MKVRPKTQLAFDNLHNTEQKYALYKESDVQTVSNGVFLDFEGPGRGGVTPEEYAAVVKIFPQDELRATVKDTFTWLCSSKPVSTYGQSLVFSPIFPSGCVWVDTRRRHLYAAIWRAIRGQLRGCGIPDHRLCSRASVNCRGSVKIAEQTDIGPLGCARVV
jgi:hypothetical protein